MCIRDSLFVTLFCYILFTDYSFFGIINMFNVERTQRKLNKQEVISMTVSNLSPSKKVLLGIQHLFAMFGATVLVPTLTGLNPSVALICAGIGTLIFHFCTEMCIRDSDKDAAGQWSAPCRQRGFSQKRTAFDTPLPASFPPASAE